MNEIDEAFQSLNVRSKSYPKIQTTAELMDRIFESVADNTFLRYTKEFREWMEVNGFRIHHDLFFVMKQNSATIYFRTEEIGAHFRLRFL